MINNAIAEEKETAIDALGIIFENTKASFAEFLPTLIQLLQELCDNSHENVRKTCICTLYRILKTMWNMAHTDLSWEPGFPPKYSVHHDVALMIKLVMDESMKMYDEEEDKNVVSALNQEMQDAINLMGPILVSNYMEVLPQHMLALLEKKAICQIEFDTSEEAADEDDEQAEYDALVISTTADLIGSLSQAIGEGFAPCFSHFWPHIAKYYKPKRPVSDRSMAMGIMAEVADGIKKEITPFTLVRALKLENKI
jgi:hypothetical protein